MKIIRLEFELSKTAVTENSPIWLDFLAELKANGLGLKGRDIYFGSIKQGRIEPNSVIAIPETKLALICERYSTPPYGHT